MNAARALDSRGYGFRELIFHVVVVLLNRVHAVVLVKRFQKEMREVAILKRRSFVGKLFLLSGGENRRADALADAVQHRAGRREIGEARVGKCSNSRFLKCDSGNNDIDFALSRL